MHHLGYETPPIVEQRMNEGFDVALDYFLGDWWINNQEYRPLVDKNSSQFNYLWFQPFSEGLLLGLLTARWDQISQMCSWVEPRIWPYPESYELGAQLFMSIASSLRPEPLRGLADLEAGVDKCRGKKQKLAFKAWLAARALDQKAFDQAIKESLAHYLKNYQAELASVQASIGIVQSVIVLSAMRLGLSFPSNLTEREAALLITRESLGLQPK